MEINDGRLKLTSDVQVVKTRLLFMDVSNGKENVVNAVQLEKVIVPTL